MFRMTAVEIIPECWINIEDNIETAFCWENLFGSDADSLGHIRQEGSPIWNDHPDGFNVASAHWYQSYLKEREIQRNQNALFVTRTVRDIIPHSRLATYGNFEYDEGRESKYTMCVNVPYSLDALSSNIYQAPDVEEIWMSPIVDYMMQIYLQPTGEMSGNFPTIPQQNEPDILGCINPRLYKVDNSQHFELEMNILSTKEIWSRPLAAPPTSIPFPNYESVLDVIYTLPNIPKQYPYPAPFYSHDVTYISPYKSTVSSSDSSTCSGSSNTNTSLIHTIYQTQFVFQIIAPKMQEELTLDTADLSRFLLFTLDENEKDDCVLQTLNRVSTWLSQVYPTKHAKKLEVEKQLLASYTYSTSKSPDGPHKIFFCPPLSEAFLEEPPLRLPPSQAKSTPATPPVGVKDVKTPPRHLSLPLSFSAVTKGCCTKTRMEPCIINTGDKKPLTDKPLPCTTRKSRSKHRPPHPANPRRPAGVYTTQSGYKYFSPPRTPGSGEEK